MKINKGLSMMELVTVIVIIILLTGAMLPAIDRQLTKSVVNMEAEKLANDLRLAQQMALTRRDGYQYYAVIILGVQCGNPTGGSYKIVRCGDNAVPPNPPALPIQSSSYIVFKSPLAADNPPILDQNMNFDKRVIVNYPWGTRIIFTTQGSATSDGQALIPAASPIFISSVSGGFSKQVSVSPMTGRVDVN